MLRSGFMPTRNQADPATESGSSVTVIQRKMRLSCPVAATVKMIIAAQRVITAATEKMSWAIGLRSHGARPTPAMATPATVCTVRPRSPIG
jgi:hypothetical protein